MSVEPRRPNVELLDATLRRLGFSKDDLSTYSGRKSIQHIVYIAQQFGLELGFSFNWYHHAPYSPELTKVIVMSADEKQPTNSQQKKERGTRR